MNTSATFPIIYFPPCVVLMVFSNILLPKILSHSRLFGSLDWGAPGENTSEPSVWDGHQIPKTKI